jgi:GNAT superfamily N-acetyltransferase
MVLSEETRGLNCESGRPDWQSIRVVNTQVIQMSSDQIRQPSGSEIEVAGAVLGRAFRDEPIFCAVIQEPNERLDLCTLLFTANLQHAVRYGGVLVNGPNPDTVKGVIYWVSKPEPELSTDELAGLGYTSVFERWGDQLDRIGQMEEQAVRALGPLEEPWCYLAGVGVDPDSQGQGYGSKLITRLVATSFDMGISCALVTDGERNVPLYERCGFQTVASGNTSVGKVQFWSMVAFPSDGERNGG